MIRCIGWHDLFRRKLREAPKVVCPSDCEGRKLLRVVEGVQVRRVDNL
jgi:hypothetical protein